MRTSLWDEAEPIHTPASGGAPTSWSCARRTAHLLADYAAGRSARPAHRHAALLPGRR
ncbi:MAG: hypothetical protein R2746_11505 [Acidimicrobiales bacterium]